MNKILAIMASLLLTFQVQAAWQLDNSQSKLTFVTTKKINISEVQTFTALDAEISAQGEVKLTIDLASIDTKIAKRDERMKQHLFELEKFSQASFSAHVDLSSVNQLAIGQFVQQSISGTITLHGQSQELTLAVQITKLADNGLQVVSLEPVILYAQQFDLIKGIATLQQLASLPSIGQSVPLYFVLNFKQK